MDPIRQPRAKQPCPFLRGGASTQVFIVNDGDSLNRYIVMLDSRFNDSRFNDQPVAAIFSCASINLSYKARKPSESTRVPPMIGMKFVSPVQRGTM